MSIKLIQQFYTKVEQIIRYGGSRNESSLRKPFQDLLEQYARAKNLVLVAEVELTTKKGTRIRPDGVLKDALRKDWGFWESKDEKDKIEDEIKAKLNTHRLWDYREQVIDLLCRVCTVSVETMKISGEMEP